MDSIKLTLFLVLSLQSGFVFSQSVFFDMGEHSGFVRGSDGHYVKVSSNGSVRSLTSNTALALVEKPVIQTSKGAFEVTLNRAASVDLNRVGAAVSKFARVAGPLGMAIGAAQLVCDLTDICNSGGIWTTTIPDTPEFPSSYPASNGSWWGWADSTYPSIQQACSDPLRLSQNIGEGATYLRHEQLNEGTYQCFGTLPQFPGSEYSASNTTKYSECANGYTLSGSDCQRNSGPSTPATDADWAAKESSLNDSAFVPELFDKGVSIPVSTPTFSGSSPVISSMGSTTKTLKDGAGNVTGTEVTTDILTVTDAATAENPNRMSVTQSTITNTYNTSNVLTGSTTTVTEPLQPPPKTENIEVEFDAMTDQPIEEQQISAVFSHTSWGSGSCPADREINYHYGTLIIPFTPACDAAVMVKPVILLLAALASLFIIIGALRND